MIVTVNAITLVERVDLPCISVVAAFVLAIGYMSCIRVRPVVRREFAFVIVRFCCRLKWVKIKKYLNFEL